MPETFPSRKSLPAMRRSCLLTHIPGQNFLLSLSTALIYALLLKNSGQKKFPPSRTYHRPQKLCVYVHCVHRVCKQQYIFFGSLPVIIRIKGRTSRMKLLAVSCVYAVKVHYKDSHRAFFHSWLLALIFVFCASKKLAAPSACT